MCEGWRPELGVGRTSPGALGARGGVGAAGGRGGAEGQPCGLWVGGAGRPRPLSAPGAPWGPARGLAPGRCGGMASLPEGPPYAPRGPG